MISFACEEGYQGTWTYTCLDGVYKNKNVNTCTPKSPTIMYPIPFYELTQGESINTGAPHVTNIVTVYSVEGNLPEGLTLDETTGVVSGTLNDVLETTTFSVVGKPYVGAFGLRQVGVHHHSEPSFLRGDRGLQQGQLRLLLDLHVP